MLRDIYHNGKHDGVKNQNSGTGWLKNKRFNSAVKSLSNRYRDPEAKGL